jgi:4-hydroxybenzoate polyprenyltransferase
VINKSGGSLDAPGSLQALALACHPVPTVAVTTMTVALAAGAGNGVGTCLLVALAVFAGQLSIGWSNDVVDARRDAAVGRTDKPVVIGTVTPRTVATAAALALVVTVPASLALGWRAGCAQLIGVTCGWAYNLGLKSTVWSWLPFAIAFAALPAVATYALPDPVAPSWWALAAGALIGVSAHLGNVLPDLAEDDATGVRGLPHRLGATVTAASGLAAALGAGALVVIMPAGRAPWWAWLGLAAAALIAIAAFGVVRRRPSSEAAFYATMAVAAIGVALLAASPSFP